MQSRQQPTGRGCRSTIGLKEPPQDKPNGKGVESCTKKQLAMRRTHKPTATVHGLREGGVGTRRRVRTLRAITPNPPSYLALPRSRNIPVVRNATAQMSASTGMNARNNSIAIFSSKSPSAHAALGQHAKPFRPRLRAGHEPLGRGGFAYRARHSAHQDP